MAGAMSYGGRGALYGVCIMEDLTAVYLAGAHRRKGVESERKSERERESTRAPCPYEQETVVREVNREADPRSRVQRAKRIYTR